MTFGLLSAAYNDYRIKQESKERYKGMIKHYISWPAKGALAIFEILLTILSILCLYDIYAIKGWNTYILIAILALFFILVLGDVLALSIIVYWVIAIRENSQILTKLKTFTQ